MVVNQCCLLITLHSRLGYFKSKCIENTFNWDRKRSHPEEAAIILLAEWCSRSTWYIFSATKLCKRFQEVQHFQNFSHTAHNLFIVSRMWELIEKAKKIYRMSAFIAFTVQERVGCVTWYKKSNSITLRQRVRYKTQEKSFFFHSHRKVGSKRSWAWNYAYSSST